MRERLSWPWVLIFWTVFLWLSRLRNVLADDDLTTSGRAIRIAVVAIFVVLALVAAETNVRRSLTVRPKAGPIAMAVLIGWTVLYWPIRGIGILVGDWSVGFKVAHTVLMVVSLVLAALAWRSRSSGPAAVSSR